MSSPKVKLNEKLGVVVDDLQASVDSRLPMKIDSVTCQCQAGNTSMHVFLAPTSKPCPKCGSLILLRCPACEKLMCAGCLEEHAKKYRREHEVDTITDFLLQRNKTKN